MLIIGAKGLAKEVLNIFHQNGELKGLCFYDDLSTDAPEELYGEFPVLRNMEQVKKVFEKDNQFVIGVGNPQLRFTLYNKFKDAGGMLISAISPLASLGHYGTTIGQGTIIMAGTVISNGVIIGRGCLINPNCTISHDTILGDFAEISPGVHITGDCRIGRLTYVGTGAIILPRKVLGDRVIIGAGAVVTKNFGDGLTVAGVPAKLLNKI
ncbi:MAG: acetyltransferase [Ferruginibacter sp.]